MEKEERLFNIIRHLIEIQRQAEQNGIFGYLPVFGGLKIAGIKDLLNFYTYSKILVPMKLSRKKR